jgi:hypothetical protein
VPVTITDSLKVTVIAITSPTFLAVESLVLDETEVTVGAVASVIVTVVDLGEPVTAV